MRYLSPLRYPGAKSGLVSCIRQIITTNPTKPKIFIEPFVGGAATTLKLLADGVVPRAVIADADPMVATFWAMAAIRTEWLVDRIRSEPVTLERWDYWRSYEGSSNDDPELAVKCLFLNRTTFSGILHGRAGPIGGRQQKSPYSIDCRFNKEALSERIRFVGDLFRSGRLIGIWRSDWQSTFKLFAERFPAYGPDDVVVYLDPPYVNKADRLYTAAFASFDHVQLAEHLNYSLPYRWILSYDDHTDIRSLYKNGRIQPREMKTPRWRVQRRLVELRYSASGRKGRGRKSELIITTLPRFPDDDVFRPLS